MTGLTTVTLTSITGRREALLGLTEEQRRVYRRIPAHVDYVPHPSFSLPATAKRLFGQSAEDIDVPSWSAPSDGRPGPRAHQGRPARLSPRQEEELFLRYNYARYRLAELLPAQRRRFSLGRARQMLLWYKRATKARTDLVKANMALVLAMAKRTTIPSVEFTDLAAEGNMALLRSIEKFDVSRGYKFSTYACRAILKCFNRVAAKTGRYRQLFPVEFDPDLQRCDTTGSKHEREWEDSISAVRQILARNPAGLTEMERQIVIYRFALTADGKGRTLAEVGRLVGLSNERVRQLLAVALQKIRAALYKGFLAS